MSFLFTEQRSSSCPLTSLPKIYWKESGAGGDKGTRSPLSHPVTGDGGRGQKSRGREWLPRTAFPETPQGRPSGHRSAVAWKEHSDEPDFPSLNTQSCGQPGKPRVTHTFYQGSGCLDRSCSAGAVNTQVPIALRRLPPGAGAAVLSLCLATENSWFTIYQDG